MEKYFTYENALNSFYNPWYEDFGASSADNYKCYKAYRISGLFQRCVAVQTSMLFGSIAKMVVSSEDENFNKGAQRQLNTFLKKFEIKNNLSLLQTLMVCEHERMIRGEVFIRVIRRKTGDVPFQLQIIPSSQVPFINKKLDGNRRVENGIEYNGLEVSAYYVRLNDKRILRVPKSQMFHIVYREDANQARGVSPLKSSIGVEASLEKYKEADIEHKTKRAQFIGSIETPMDINPHGSLDEESEEQKKPRQEQIGNKKHILVLPQGTEMKFSNNTDSGDDYVAHVNSEKKDICMGVGVPYFLANEDFSNMNDRSAREIMNLYKRRLGQINDMYVSNFLQPLYEKFVRAYHLPEVAGRFNMKFYSQPYAYAHPVQELKAKELQVGLGMKSKIDLCEEMGVNWQDVINDNKKYKDLLNENELSS